MRRLYLFYIYLVASTTLYINFVMWEKDENSSGPHFTTHILTHIPGVKTERSLKKKSAPTHKI